jgi:Spy/CpxP family protein refolding chaperone
MLALLLAYAPVQDVRAGEDDGGAKKARKARGKREGKPKRAKSGLRGEYQIMASVLAMTDAQKAQLQEIVKKHQEAQKAWMAGEDGQKMKALSAEAKKAREAGDKDKAREIQKQARELGKERGKLKEAQQREILSLLTAEQKAKWEGFTLYRSMMRRYKKCELTEDQQAKLKAFCQAEAKDLPSREADRKAYHGAMKTLYGKVDTDILTPEQREKLAAKRAPREKKDRPAKKDRAAKKGRGKKGGEDAVIVE